MMRTFVAALLAGVALPAAFAFPAAAQATFPSAVPRVVQFNASGTWKVPGGVTMVMVNKACAGGGAGGEGRSGDARPASTGKGAKAEAAGRCADAPVE